MRGMDERSGLLFSYVDLEGRVPGSHPLRAIRLIVNEALSVLTARFEALYSPFGRPSIPPEQLLRAMLLQAFYSIRGSTSTCLSAGSSGSASTMLFGITRPSPKTATDSSMAMSPQAFCALC